MNAPVHFDPIGDAYALPLDAFDVSNPKLYQDDIWHPYFERLRREAPVHYTQDGMYGSYWSVTPSSSRRSRRGRRSGVSRRRSAGPSSRKCGGRSSIGRKRPRSNSRLD